MRQDHTEMAVPKMRGGFLEVVQDQHSQIRD
jgi:hypothetical protein